MKIVVTGSSGQLGSEVIKVIKKGSCTIGSISKQYENADVIGINSRDLDITDLCEVLKYFNDVKPNIIINTAAYTNVDDCEKNFQKALNVNALGARNVAMASNEINAKLVHISTDYIFDGASQSPYREYDRGNPLTNYGKSKFQGEKYVQDLSSKYFIIRTAWLYGYEGKNFVKTILKAAKENSYLEVVEDQRGNPTIAEDLVYHLLRIALTDEYGIYHCVGKGECSWYDFACKIVEHAGINCLIKPITSDRLNRAARRPFFSVLDNMMLRTTVGDEMRNWEEALIEFIRKYELVER